MNRIEFMEQLEYLLQDIPDEDKADALAYYQDYLEEAGDEHEDEVITEFGSPERIAAIIRSDLYGNMEDGGSFTETGYQDERFREPGYQVAQHRDLPDAGDMGEFKDKKANPVRNSWQNDTFLMKLLKVGALLIALAILAPLALGAGGTVLSLVAALLITVVMLILLVGFGTIVLCIMSVIVIVMGIVTLFVNPWSGIFVLGVGLLLLGCSFIGVVLSVLVYGRMVPYGIRGIVDGISRILHRNKRRPQ